jgi:hypothetical protein
VRENKQSNGKESEDTREARGYQRPKTTRIRAFGIVTLLALVGSGVIGLAVGAGLGLLVEGD